MSIHLIIQSAQNSFYPTIFNLIHNLITYTTIRTNHLKMDKNTFTMVKYPPKLLESHSNRRTIIQRHIKLKRPKKLQQKISCKTEETEVNAIMEQLDESYGNGHCRRNNTNHSSPLYESKNDKGNQHRTKTNTPIESFQLNMGFSFTFLRANYLRPSSLIMRTRSFLFSCT